MGSPGLSQATLEKDLPHSVSLETTQPKVGWGPALNPCQEGPGLGFSALCSASATLAVLLIAEALAARTVIRENIGLAKSQWARGSGTHCTGQHRG